MDLNEIKEIIEKSGGKFIIVENGKPEVVVMSFEDFKKDLEKKPETTISKPVIQEKLVEKESHTFPETKNKIPKEFEEEPLKLEDLPF